MDKSEAASPADPRMQEDLFGSGTGESEGEGE